jgi:ATP-binding cassette subfamily B protein
MQLINSKMFNMGNTSFIIILKSLRPIFPKLVIILLLILLWTCFETFLLYMLKWVVDSGNKFDYLEVKWLLYLSIFTVIVFFIEVPMRVANFLHVQILPKAAQILRENLTARLLNKNIGFFSNEKLGNLVSRITELPQATENIIKILLYGIIAGSFNFVVTIVLVALNLGILALYFFIWYTLMMVVGVYFIKKTINFSQNYAHGINIANAELTEVLQNILNIKIAAKEFFELNRIKHFFHNVFYSQTQLEMLSFKADTIRSIISGLLLIGLFGFILLKVSDKSATFGDLIFVISSAFLARRDIWRVSLQLTEIYKDFGFIKEVEILTSSDSENQEIIAKQNSLKNIKSIKFEAVSFGFDNNSLVLKDIDFEIKQGIKVALVGASGAGKTTLAKVLQGINRMNKGRILINNLNQTAYFDHSIMEHITYIPQEPVLFNRTILENIIYLNDKIDANSLAKIAKITLCDDFIQKLPQKYDTVLTNLGNNLSAGQKQRIAVARAFCSKAKWIILDEPSSALDTVTEKQLINNLLAFCKDRTLIIITHNPKIMRLMDKILLMQNGCKVAEGSYNELIKKSKPFKNLIRQV